MSISIEDAVKEIQQKEATEKAALDAELKRIDESFKPFVKEQARKRRQAIEAEEARRQKEAERVEHQLEGEARQMFFAGTPGASEELYLKVREKLREEVLLKRAQQAKERAVRHPIYRL